MKVSSFKLYIICMHACNKFAKSRVKPFILHSLLTHVSSIHPQVLLWNGLSPPLALLNESLLEKGGKDPRTGKLREQRDKLMSWTVEEKLWCNQFKSLSAPTVIQSFLTSSRPPFATSFQSFTIGSGTRNEPSSLGDIKRWIFFMSAELTVGVVASETTPCRMIKLCI